MRIAAVRGSAGLLIDAGRDQNDPRALERVIVAVDDVDLTSERNAIANVGRDRLGRLARAVDQYDFARCRE